MLYLPPHEEGVGDVEKKRKVFGIEINDNNH
jgi:hypothetical protein